MSSLQNDPNDMSGSEDEFWPLSGKPYFDVILKKTHVQPLYTLYVPANVADLLPPGDVPVVFSYRGQKWATRYTVVPREGRSSRTSIKWREFVIDNHLKQGDACVFELTKYSNTIIEIRVQILKGDFPPQLLDDVDGHSLDNPIVI